MKITNIEFPVTSTWIQTNGRRLDSKPYLSGAIEARMIIKEISVQKDQLKNLTKEGSKGIFHAGRLGRNYVENPEHGIPFMSGRDITNADLSNLLFLSRNQINETPELIIHKDWILITRSGTIGRMIYSRSDMDGLACSEDVLRVVPDPQYIAPGYLYSYLSSNYGHSQIISGTYGSIIRHIEPQHIVNIPVPRFGDKVETLIHEKIFSSARLRSECQQLIIRATNDFFTSVSLRDITPYYWHHQGADLSSHNIISQKSFRALNYNPRFLELSRKIKARSWMSLGDICLPGTLRQPNRYRRVDAEPGHGYQLIGQKMLFRQRLKGRWVAKFTLDEDVIVEPGTILTAARGTLGENELFCRCEFVWGAGVQYAYSDNLLRIVANEKTMLRGCLFAFMRSETAFRMLRSISVGGKLQVPHYSLLPELPIPLPKRRDQERINELIVDAYEKRHLSNCLENEAIKMVEDLIRQQIVK